MNDKRYEGLSAGIVLIGIGILFLIPGLGIWPWILAVIGVASLPAAIASKRGWLGYQSAVLLIGLALLFWSGFFWPGILILVGISVLLGGIFEPMRPQNERDDDADRGPDSDEPPFSTDEPLFDDKDEQSARESDTRRL